VSSSNGKRFYGDGAVHIQRPPSSSKMAVNQVPTSLGRSDPTSTIVRPPVSISKIHISTNQPLLSIYTPSIAYPPYSCPTPKEDAAIKSGSLSTFSPTLLSSPLSPSGKGGCGGQTGVLSSDPPTIQLSFNRPGSSCRKRTSETGRSLTKSAIDANISDNSNKDSKAVSTSYSVNEPMDGRKMRDNEVKTISDSNKDAMHNIYKETDPRARGIAFDKQIIRNRNKHAHIPPPSPMSMPPPSSKHSSQTVAMHGKSAAARPSSSRGALSEGALPIQKPQLRTSAAVPYLPGSVRVPEPTANHQLASALARVKDDMASSTGVNNAKVFQIPRPNSCVADFSTNISDHISNRNASAYTTTSSNNNNTVMLDTSTAVSTAAAAAVATSAISEHAMRSQLLGTSRNSPISGNFSFRPSTANPITGSAGLIPESPAERLAGAIEAGLRSALNSSENFPGKFSGNSAKISASVSLADSTAVLALYNNSLGRSGNGASKSSHSSTISSAIPTTFTATNNSYNNNSNSNNILPTSYRDTITMNSNHSFTPSLDNPKPPNPHLCRSSASKPPLPQMTQPLPDALIAAAATVAMQLRPLTASLRLHSSSSSSPSFPSPSIPSPSASGSKLPPRAPVRQSEDPAVHSDSTRLAMTSNAASQPLLERECQRPGSRSDGVHSPYLLISNNNDELDPDPSRLATAQSEGVGDLSNLNVYDKDGLLLYDGDLDVGSTRGGGIIRGAEEAVESECAGGERGGGERDEAGSVIGRKAGGLCMEDEGGKIDRRNVASSRRVSQDNRNLSTISTAADSTTAKYGKKKSTERAPALYDVFEDDIDAMLDRIHQENCQLDSEADLNIFGSAPEVAISAVAGGNLDINISDAHDVNGNIYNSKRDSYSRSRIANNKRSSLSSASAIHATNASSIANAYAKTNACVTSLRKGHEAVTCVRTKGATKKLTSLVAEFPPRNENDLLSHGANRHLLRNPMGIDIAQAAPMVLVLDNIMESTPEVVEMEMKKMSLEDLRQFRNDLYNAVHGEEGSKGPPATPLH